MDVDELGREGNWEGGVPSTGWALSMGAITGDVASCFTALSKRRFESLTC